MKGVDIYENTESLLLSHETKEPCSYFEYWHTKALANMKDPKKCLACFDHMIYWLGKVFDYNAAVHKELES